jgi:YD repeat-containing protein
MANIIRETGTLADGSYYEYEYDENGHIINE